MSRADAVEAVHHYGGAALEAPLVTPTTLWNWVDRAGLEEGSRPFLTELRDRGSISVTFAEFRERVAAVASALTARSIGPGDTVAVLPDNAVADAAVVLGTLAMGAHTVVIGTAQPHARVAQQIAAARPAIVVGRPHRDPGEPSGAAPIDPRELVGATPGPFVPVTGGELRLYTTGSTSVSKLVRLSQYNVIVNGIALAQHHQLGPGDVVFTANPIFYANALCFVVLGSMLARCRAVLRDAFDPFAFLQDARACGATIVNLVPPMLDAVSVGRARPLPAPFRYFVTAASPLSAALAARIHDRLGARIVQGYGLTETTNFSLLMPINLGEAEYRARMIETDIPPVGRPVWGCDVRLNGTGEAAEIVMRGHSVMLGYHERPDATAEAFRGGWFRSGDLARQAPDGAFTITGRIKTLCKIGGVGVSIEEVERCALRVEGVGDFAATALPDPVQGERLHGFYVGPASPEAINRAISSAISPLASCAPLQRIDAIPRFPNGKIDRAHVRRLTLA